MDEVVTILPENEVNENESPYNQQFVKEIQASRKSKGKVINTDDLWR
ncbi:MAG: hypothetical protein K9H26_04880 [Prolixibacteraceae bacterium]|nr:hypothetical protein [Prolixibacteraceae bacterium]